MPLFMLGFMLLVGAGLIGFLKVWSDTVRLRDEVRRLRDTQDTLIDMVSSKLLEDDALSQEFLKLKIGRTRDE